MELAVMLKSLEYSVTFPSTGRTLAQSVNFQDGFGAVIGPNEAGKSFIIEMIRWLMFGTKALRGKADDYKTLKGELSVSIRGVDYRIERSASQAKLFRAEEQIAVGTRPVNDKVVQLLGYGLSVFDTAHVANQGDIEKLGSMQPTERKRMVDSVIGLGVIEDMAKSAGDEANALKRRAEDLKSSVVEPEPVIEPEGYRPSDEIKAEVDDLGVLVSEYHQLKGWLAHERDYPATPVCEITEAYDELTVLAEKQTAMEAQLAAAMATLKRLPEPSGYSNAELAAMDETLNHWEAYQLQQAFLRANPAPQYSQKDIAAFRKEHRNWTDHRTRQQAQSVLDDLLSRGHHCCPACDHKWPVASELVEEQQALLDALPQSRGEAKELAMPLEAIEAAERHLANWGAVSGEWATHQQAIKVDKPSLTRAQVDEHRRANAAAAQRRELEAEIATLRETLADQPHYGKLVANRRSHDLAMERYEADLLEYQAWQSQRADKLERLAEIEPAVLYMPELQRELDLSRSYEVAKAQAEKAQSRYDAVMVAVAGFTDEASDWTKAKDALTNLRGLVKQHLVPSLNRVASHLIKQMTGGERQKIVVDEDFNVLVDDQALNTLSGSGKAVANLALRLGLGQVLTNNVFSLFVGDEIDASMDKDRAENTSNTLQTLKQRISQILLVTHKLPVADYYISLGNSNEPDYAE